MTPHDILKEAFDADIQGLKTALENDQDMLQIVMKTIGKLCAVLVTKEIITLEEMKNILDIEEELKDGTN